MTNTQCQPGRIIEEALLDLRLAVDDAIDAADAAQTEDNYYEVLWAKAKLSEASAAVAKATRLLGLVEVAPYIGAADDKAASAVARAMAREQAVIA